jgi:hypothetical protein
MTRGNASITNFFVLVFRSIFHINIVFFSWKPKIDFEHQIAYRSIPLITEYQ